MMIVLHRTCCTTRSDSTQSCYITEHLSQWNHCLYDASTATTFFHTLNETTALVQVTDYVTHVLFWSNTLNA
ncbi:Uncharacterised protein [Segatella copri]|nr:Uncharacterised protein [Segatella copri]